MSGRTEHYFCFCWCCSRRFCSCFWMSCSLNEITMSMKWIAHINKLTHAHRTYSHDVSFHLRLLLLFFRMKETFVEVKLGARTRAALIHTYAMCLFGRRYYCHFRCRRRSAAAAYVSAQSHFRFGKLQSNTKRSHSLLPSFFLHNNQKNPEINLTYSSVKGKKASHRLYQSCQREGENWPLSGQSC